MALSQADLEAQVEHIKQLAGLERTLPVEKFALWKVRQCKQKKNRWPVSADYTWLVMPSTII